MRRLTTLSLLLLLAAAAPAQENPSQPGPDDLSDNPIDYVSDMGSFRVTFPTGCGKLLTRANEPDLYGGETFDDIVQVEYISCDRFQEKGEGFSVSGIYNLHSRDGSAAGPEQLVHRVQKVLGSFGVTIVNQKPVSRDFGENGTVEGVRVAAAEENGDGEVLVMGLLYYGDIFILTAWNQEGDLLKDPEVKVFFDSFRPFVE